MNSDKEVDTYLSNHQTRKLEKCEPIQLKHNQFLDPDGKNNNHVKMVLSHKHHKKVVTNVNKGKGTRITPDMVKGCGFFGKVGYFVKNNIKQEDVKKLGSKAINTVGKKLGISDDHLQQTNDLLNETTENFYKGNKKLVSGKTLKTVALHAFHHGVNKLAKGDDTIENIVSNISDNVIDDHYGEGFPKGSKQAKAHAKKMRMAQSNKTHFVKGSKEAK